MTIVKFPGKKAPPLLQERVEDRHKKRLNRQGARPIYFPIVVDGRVIGRRRRWITPQGRLVE